jgi:hypothetical protein
MTEGKDRGNRRCPAVIARAVLRCLVERIWLGLRTFPATPEMAYLLAHGSLPGDPPEPGPEPAGERRDTDPAPLSPVEREVWADLVKRLG